MDATIDKLDYTKRFEAVNFDRTQAEELAEALKDVSEYIIADLKDRDREYATKLDLLLVKNELKNDIHSLEVKLKADIHSLEVKIIEGFAKQRNILYIVGVLIAAASNLHYLIELIARTAN